MWYGGGDCRVSPMTGEIEHRDTRAARRGEDEVLPPRQVENTARDADPEAPLPLPPPAVVANAWRGDREVPRAEAGEDELPLPEPSVPLGTR
jgi:hypothetical protein